MDGQVKAKLYHYGLSLANVETWLPLPDCPMVCYHHSGAVGGAGIAPPLQVNNIQVMLVAFGLEGFGLESETKRCLLPENG